MTNEYYHHATQEQIANEKKATKDYTEEIKKHAIKRGTKEMESLLCAGYTDIESSEHAKEILAERKKNPLMIPYELAKRAEAFLAALNTEPIPIDTDPGIIYQD